MKKNLAALKSARSVKQKRKTSNYGNEKPLIIEPYITEKSFNLIEKEKKLTFIVDEIADKKSIKQELHDLYEAEIVEVNTARTIDGKKAFAKFKDLDSARDLATKLGLV
ncbi:MAG TPA: 50S ribosomal protein L23 [Nitrososphaeraceae archaeon]